MEDLCLSLSITLANNPINPFKKNIKASDACQSSETSYQKEPRERDLSLAVRSSVCHDKEPRIPSSRLQLPAHVYPGRQQVMGIFGFLPFWTFGE